MSLRGDRLTSGGGVLSTSVVRDFFVETDGAETNNMLSGGSQDVLEVASGETALLTLKIYARVQSYSGMASSTVGDILYSLETYFFYNTGSGVAQVGGIAYPGDSGDYDGTWAFSLSGNFIRIAATGTDADEVVQWLARAEFTVGSP